MFSVDETTGALSPLPGSPFATGAQGGILRSNAAAFSPNGALFAVANKGDNTVSVFSTGICTTAEGLATHLLASSPFWLGMRDKLTTNLSAPESLRVSTAQGGPTKYRLTHLTKASCREVAGGHEFSGEGQAALDNVLGYEISFSIGIVAGHTYFSSILKKGGMAINEAVGNPMTKSTEKIY